MRTLRLLPILLLPLFIYGQSAKEADHNRKGLEYFNQGFYQHLPKGQQREADESFDLAAAEFKAAIAVSPKSPQAYRNLARLYYVKKDFPQAADAYKIVTVLVPSDVDAYVQLALSYTQFDRFEEAARALETAKANTDNPEVIAKLDEYLRKLAEHK